MTIASWMQFNGWKFVLTSQGPHPVELNQITPLGTRPKVFGARTSPDHFYIEDPSGKFAWLNFERKIAELGSFLPDEDPLDLIYWASDQLLPRILSWERYFVVHASSVVIDERAILFVGDTGSGKSTLGASFYKEGNLLLDDDAVIITPSQTPGASVFKSDLRVLDDTLLGLALSPPEALKGSRRKHRLILEADKKLGLIDHPIAAIFHLAPAGSCHDIEIVKLSPLSAAMTLISNSFALDPGEVERAREKVSKAAKLAETLPIFELTYPRMYTALPEVRRHVIQTVESVLSERSAA